MNAKTRVTLGLGLAIAAVILVFGLFTEPSTLAAPQGGKPPSSTITHTLYLPLVTRNASNELRPNDPYLEYAWGLEAIEAARAWKLTCGSPMVTVAILDTGVDLDHPDLVDKLLAQDGIDLVNDDLVPDDDHGHGTHVAGIAAAATNNGVGVAGLGWNSRVLPIKVLASSGLGGAVDLAEGIIYAADHGADVINMSLGADVDFCPSYVQDAVNYAYERGVVLVAAGGNNGSTANFFPANCAHVLGVAATEDTGLLAGYSTSGNHINVAAPGTGIYSTLPGGGYGYKSGTSMAAPYVAGLAALLQAHYPNYTPDQIVSAIVDNADDMGPQGWDPNSGCGQVNAAQSVAGGAVADYPLCLGTGSWDVGEPGDDPLVGTGLTSGSVIVSYEPGTPHPGDRLRGAMDVQFIPALNAYQILVQPGQEQALLEQLRSDPNVVYAELDFGIFAW